MIWFFGELFDVQMVDLLFDGDVKGLCRIAARNLEVKLEFLTGIRCILRSSAHNHYTSFFGEGPCYYFGNALQKLSALWSFCECLHPGGVRRSQILVFLCKDVLRIAPTFLWISLLNE